MISFSPHNFLGKIVTSNIFWNQTWIPVLKPCLRQSLSCCSLLYIYVRWGGPWDFGILCLCLPLPPTSLQGHTEVKDVCHDPGIRFWTSIYSWLLLETFTYSKDWFPIYWFCAPPRHSDPFCCSLKCSKLIFLLPQTIKQETEAALESKFGSKIYCYSQFFLRSCVLTRRSRWEMLPDFTSYLNTSFKC